MHESDKLGKNLIDKLFTKPYYLYDMIMYL